MWKWKEGRREKRGKRLLAWLLARSPTLCSASMDRMHHRLNVGKKIHHYYKVFIQKLNHIQVVS